MKPSRAISRSWRACTSSWMRAARCCSGGSQSPTTMTLEQISAYYDPRAKVMVVGDWLPPEQQRAALIHELVHALQDREIALEGFISPDPGRGDQLLARQALIEGEAVALTIDFLLKAQNMDITKLPDLSNTQGLIATSAGGPMIAKAPKFLRALLLFPYLEGVGFA